MIVDGVLAQLEPMRDSLFGAPGKKEVKYASLRLGKSFTELTCRPAAEITWRIGLGRRIVFGFLDKEGHLSETYDLTDVGGGHLNPLVVKERAV
jgi:hypothetical protein